ncbi:MAG: AAA family ATPase [Acidobacteriota bacterium]
MTTVSAPTVSPPRMFDLDRYLHHFFLICEPFSLTPDPSFLFLSESHEDALAAIEMGVMEKRGLTVLTGEVGTGKTTLARWVLSEWEDHLETAYLSTGTFTFDDILRNTLEEFGLPSGGSREERLTKLQGFLERSAAEGKTVVLLIDEAQNIPNDTFEQLRLLLNFETSKEKLFQLVLIGQPELDKKLRRASLRHIEGRIAVRARLRPLQARECAKYVEHRLNVAGTTSEIFGGAALKTIIRESRGIPRRLNVLCHNALLFAFGQDQQKVSRATALQAVRQMNAATPGMRRSSRQVPAWLVPALGGAVAVAALLAIGWFLARYFVADLPFPSEPTQAESPAAAPAAAVPAAAATVADRDEEEPDVDTPPAPAPAPTAARMVVASLETRTTVASGGGELADLVEARYGEVSDELIAVVKNANPGLDDTLSPDQSVLLPLQVLVDGRTLRLPSAGPSAAPSSTPTAAPSVASGPSEATTYLMPPGSNLWEVISQTYGRYDDILLQAVLDQNPEITDVRQIEEGTRIRLPDPAAVRSRGPSDE